MDYTALKNEINTDPKALGYAPFVPNAPGSVCNLINGYTQTMVKPITAAVALTWAAAGPMSAIVDASNNTSHPARASCLAFLHALSSGMGFDMNHSDVMSQFGGWVTAGVITQAQHDDLVSRSTQPASRAEAIALVDIGGSVTQDDLKQAGVI